MIRKPYQQENPQKKKRTQVDDMKILPKIILISTGFFFLKKKNLYSIKNPQIIKKQIANLIQQLMAWLQIHYFLLFEELLILPYINEKLNMFNFHPN
jgi:hypothetical protein